MLWNISIFSICLVFSLHVIVIFFFNPLIWWVHKHLFPIMLSDLFLVLVLWRFHTVLPNYSRARSRGVHCEPRLAHTSRRDTGAVQAGRQAGRGREGKRSRQKQSSRAADSQSHISRGERQSVRVQHSSVELGWQNKRSRSRAAPRESIPALFPGLGLHFDRAGRPRVHV